MALISNTIDIRGNNAPTFWKLTRMFWDVCEKGKVAEITASGYASPVQCLADPERYSYRQDAKTYTIDSGEKSGITEEDGYTIIKSQDIFLNALDCLDWKDWDEQRWRAYCDAVKAGTDTAYILDKVKWDAYLLTLTTVHETSSNITETVTETPGED